ncbi:hypothetical protein CQ14_24765 [Bradyrhizobium lablabi]|uniref:Uncharacterized protein n=1 Tax=Bradyrhizobium lablabi TaxID=722472 RepID=A0A0R3MM14_9BRAD|nr:hypothetical protein CQ14_24765 [Bradyrhizobium lablabi]
MVMHADRHTLTSNDEPDSIARLFQLPILQGDLLRYADTKAEHLCWTLHLQKVQQDGVPVVGDPIQFHELDGTARQAELIQHLITSSRNTWLVN